MGTLLLAPALVVVLVVGSVLASSASIRHTAGGATQSSWGSALEVPGAARFNAFGDGEPSSISCTAPGACTMGGFALLNAQSNIVNVFAQYVAFVASEAQGSWRTGHYLSNLLRPDSFYSANAAVTSVSCASPGSCSVGGDYQDVSDATQAFVANQVHGHWQRAMEVPGTGAMNVFGAATVTSVSCPAAGECSAGGHFTDAHSAIQAFVVDEQHGTWGRAIEVPGTATLNLGAAASADAQVASLSCASPRNCGAGGYYVDAKGHQQAFVVNEVAGIWKPAIEAPEAAALNAGGHARINAVSCRSPGACVGVGVATDASKHAEPIVIDEAGGTWASATVVGGLGALGGVRGSLDAVSCASGQDCAAGGSYSTSARQSSGFVVDATAGVWGSARALRRLWGLNEGRDALVESMSCAAASDCSAGGFYTDAQRHSEPFVASEVDGVWHAAIEVRGSTTICRSLGRGTCSASIYALSCATKSSCSAVGAVGVGPGGLFGGNVQPFVVDFGPPPTVTSLSPPSGPARGGFIAVVHGRHLDGVLVVDFGSRAATHVQVVNADAVRVVVPAGEGTVTVRVTTPDGTSVAAVAGRFRYSR